MDRYAVCQFASLRARGAPAAAERRARRAYRVFPRPDITFLLTVEPAVAYDRIEARGYDHEEMAYLTAATAAYRSLPESAEFVVIDGNRPVAEITAELTRLVAIHRVPAVTIRIRNVMIAAGSLLAGLAMAGWQLAETF
jgi:dTMP kinase